MWDACPELQIRCRFRAIVLGPPMTINKKLALMIIGGIWTLAALVATPTFVDYNVQLAPIGLTPHEDNNVTATTLQLQCMPQSDVFDKCNAVFILCASYIIPQTVIFCRYYGLVRFIVHHSHKSVGTLTSSFVSTNRKRIVKMLIIIAVFFSLAWFPYFVLLVDAVRMYVVFLFFFVLFFFILFLTFLLSIHLLIIVLIIYYHYLLLLFFLFSSLLIIISSFFFFLLCALSISAR